MNNKFLGIILIAIMAIMPASAQTIAGDVVKTDIAKVLEKTYYNSLTGFDVEVKVMNVPFRELIIPDGKVSYKVTSPEGRYLPRDIKRVDVYVDNNFIKTLNLPVAMKAFKEVIVARDAIMIGQAVTAENTVIKKMDCADRLEHILGEESLKKDITTKKPMRAGEIIDKRFVKIKPDVVRNTEVRVFFSSNDSLMVTIDAVALEDGLIGEWINVENKNYKRIYKGKIIGENRVLVSI